MEFMIFIIYMIYNIVENIKIRKLGWVGHIIRMEDVRILRKVFSGKFHITRPLQKPRTNWGVSSGGIYHRSYEYEE